MNVLNEFSEKKEQLLTVVSRHPVVKRFRLNYVVIRRSWMRQQFVQAVFEGEQIRHNQGHFVKLVGFPKTINPALKGSFVPFKK